MNKLNHTLHWIPGEKFGDKIDRSKKPMQYFHLITLSKIVLATFTYSWDTFGGPLYFYVGMYEILHLSAVNEQALEWALTKEIECKPLDECKRKIELAILDINKEVKFLTDRELNLL